MKYSLISPEINFLASIVHAYNTNKKWHVIKSNDLYPKISIKQLILDEMIEMKLLPTDCYDPPQIINGTVTINNQTNNFSFPSLARQDPVFEYAFRPTEKGLEEYSEHFAEKL